MTRRAQSSRGARLSFNQCDSGVSGPANCFINTSTPAIVGIHVLGSQGVGSCPSVMHNEQDCQLAPRSGYTPSAPPMQKSLCKKSPGPIVFAKQGINVNRDMNECSEFCSTVSGCSATPNRCVCFFHAPAEYSPASCGSQNAM